MITKQIERGKEIRKAAKSYYYKIYVYEDNRRDYFGSAYDEGFIDAIFQTVETAFIAGAKFADDFPRQGLVKIDDVRSIYNMWLENGTCNFLDYFYNYCDKEGWL